MSRAVVDAKEFSHAMSKISKILKKCAIPILEEVCLRIQNGRCTLTATDLETWLTAELPASGDDMFFVFRKTKDILRACSHFAGELTMEFSGTRSGSKKAGKILLRCERRGAEFEVYDGADYPNMPQAPEGDAFSVSSARLSACVERVRYAAEKPSVSARPAAICVQFCGNRVYALDGTRLACDTLEGVSFPKPFLVRADVLAHLSAFGKEDMTVRIGSSHVLFASGNLRMLARLQGVDTYNVDAVIPKGYRESVTVKTADFVRELNYLKECSALTAKPYVRFAGEQLSIAASGGAFETGIEVRGRGDMVLGFDLYRDFLLRMKVRQECCRKLCGNCYTESEYIFVNDMGEPYQPNYVTQHFKLVLRKNHLRNIRFHDLRHTCASLLLKNGVPMKDIQEWLGHSSYNTTANIYAHLDTSSKNTSASKMSNVVIIEPGISTSV